MNDLDAVRLLAEEPTDESVSRTRYKLTRLQASPRRSSAPRWLIPATAGGMVIAVVTAGGLLSLRDEGQSVGPMAAASSTPSTVPSLSPSPVAPKVDTKPLDLATTIADLAAKAEALPFMQIEPNQFIYEARENQVIYHKRLPDGATTDYSPGIEETWLEVQGLLAVCDHVGPLPESEIDRKRFRKFAPHWDFPTPNWLAAMPIDPPELLRRVRASVPSDPYNTVDNYAWQRLHYFYYRSQIMMPPKVKAAWIRAMALMPGVTAHEFTYEGRIYVAIKHPMGKTADDSVLFDPASGEAVGTWTHTTVMPTPEPEPTPTMNAGRGKFEFPEHQVRITERQFVSGKCVRP